MKDLKPRAHHHMREALGFGWRAESHICDFAIAAMEAEGYDETRAADAVRAVWSEHFEINPPV